MLMVKNAGTFLSLFTANVLTFLITVCQSFSNLHWYFPCCKCLGVTNIKHKNWLQKTKVRPKKNCIWLEKQTAELRVIIQTYDQASQTLDSAFDFLWRFENLNRFCGWMFESLECLFWNKYSAYFFDHRETLTIFENPVCKKHIYTPTCI